MKLIKKMLIGLVTAAAFAGSAQASVINVGGVVWDPDSTFDFSGTTATMTQSINSTSGELTGFGNVTLLNNTLQTTFCPGCELTFKYSGFVPIGGSAVVVPGPTSFGTSIQYTGGIVRLFVDSTPETNGGTNMTAANTSDGILWADLIQTPGTTFTGSNFFPILLQGGGVLDIIGGLAFGNLNTNTRPNGADISFSTTFTRFPGLISTPLNSTGSGTFDGNSIPEPGSLALIGLGLLGAAVTRRRRVVK